MVIMTRVNIVNRQSLRTRKGYPRLGILFSLYSPGLMQVGAFSCHNVPRPQMGIGSRHKRLIDTSGSATQAKRLDIFRSECQGNCLGSVGRWGLPRQARGAFSARKPLKRAFYRGFRARGSGILTKNDPNCHPPEWQFGAQSGKTRSFWGL